MDAQAIFAIQFVSSLLVWGVVLRLFARPHLGRLTRDRALAWLTLPHVFRHLGLVFLVPGVVHRPLPPEFAGPAAFGDLFTAGLALVALVALYSGWRGRIALAWLFNVVGTIDLINALRHVDVAPLFGAAWYIPTFVVPLLLVTHFASFARLLRDRAERSEPAVVRPRLESAR